MYGRFSRILAILLLVTSFGYKVQALEVGIGARLGVDVSFNIQWPGDVITEHYRWAKWPVSANFTAGIFVDLRLTEWFSLTPAFNFTNNHRHTLRPYTLDFDFFESDGSTLRITSNSFDFEVLAKFHTEFWYFATGLGTSFYSPQKFTMVNSNGDKKVLDNYSDGLSRKKFIGFNLLFDSGFYFPVGSDNHNIFIGWRTNLTLNTLNVLPEYDRGKQTLTMIPISTGVSLGYVYRFV